MVIQRHTSVIFGLDISLTNLTNKDNALEIKIGNEEQRATSEESRIEDRLETKSQELEDSINLNNTNSITRDNALKDRLDAVQGDDTIIGSIAKSEKDAKAFAKSLMDSTSGDIDALESLINIINGSSSEEGSFRKAIQEVVGVAPEALNTLEELATAINGNPDLYGTIMALISSNITAAKEELKGTVSAAFDTFKEIEDALGVINGQDTTVGSIAKAEKDAKAFAIAEVAAERLRAESTESSKLNVGSNLSDISDKAAARTSLNVFSKAETNEEIRLGGALFITEIQTVSDDKIILNNIAKNNMIFNFSTVRYVDGDMVSWDIPITNISGAEYQLHPNYTGQFNNKLVVVQYAYVPAV